MLSPQTHLYLIRHGQAFSNIEPVIAGMKGDAGLTPTGIQQAGRLRDRLAATREIAPDVFLSSSLPRAVQTAQIIAPALGLSPTLDDELQELRPAPEGDGLHRDEYVRRFGWVNFEDDPERPVGPGGESWSSFVMRCARTLDRITREHANTSIVAVCHGGVVDAAFLHFFQMPLDQIPAASFYTHNTSITHWVFDARNGRERWRLLRYNDDAHLSGLSQGRSIEWPRAQELPDEESPSVPLPTEPESSG